MSRHENGRWLELGVHRGEQVVRAEPFEAIEIGLQPWWEGVAPTSERRMPRLKPPIRDWESGFGIRDRE